MDIFYDKLAWPDIKQAIDKDYIVILPLGCTEEQGPHLPIDCDTWMVTTRVIEGAKKAKDKYGVKVFVMPTLPYGPAEEHMAFPGTISLSFETWHQVIKEITKSLIRHGFRRIIVVKGCGGHFDVDSALFELWTKARREGKNTVIEIYGEQGWAKLGELVKKYFPKDTGVHACEVVTSWQLARRPELVRMDRIKKPKYKPPQSWKWWLMEEISDTGATSNPLKHQRELGEKMLNELSNYFCEYLKEFDYRTRKK